jgi:hypothetical protein
MNINYDPQKLYIPEMGDVFYRGSDPNVYMRLDPPLSSEREAIAMEHTVMFVCLKSGRVHEIPDTEQFIKADCELIITPKKEA